MLDIFIVHESFISQEVGQLLLPGTIEVRNWLKLPFIHSCSSTLRSSPGRSVALSACFDRLSLSL